jgi:hypothetical protein
MAIVQHAGRRLPTLDADQTKMPLASVYFCREKPAIFL